MILIIDDDAAVRSSLTFLLKRAGFELEAVPGPEEALVVVRQTTLQLILMDMNFTLTTTGEEGIQLLKQVKVFQPDVPVILMTAWGSISLAVQGMQAGAFDFVTKPWNNLVLLKSIRTAIELSEQKKEQKMPLNRLDADNKFHFDKIIGQSAPLMDVLGTVSRIAPTNASVLITGESGTGKELIAEAIHTNSSRAKEPFVKVNLGGLSQSLFESEMFGHKKGAFTDAYIDRTGRFEMANKGTIFLDEIGDMPMELQTRLLRVLSNGFFYRVGGHQPIKADVRIIAATNQNLEQRVKDGLFREDLYHRLNVIRLRLPPLRERLEDIAPLAEHFLRTEARALGVEAKRLTPEALARLEAFRFPGNVRQLENLCRWLLVMAPAVEVRVEDLPEEIREASENAPARTAGASSEAAYGDWTALLEELVSAKLAAGESGIWAELFPDFERTVIRTALNVLNGRRIEAAQRLGLGRNTITRKIQELGIEE